MGVKLRFAIQEGQGLALTRGKLARFMPLVIGLLVASVVVMLFLQSTLFYSSPATSQILDQPPEQAFAPKTLTQFERLFIAGRTTPPQDIDQAWEEVELKDNWGWQRRRLHQEGWYRTTIHLDNVPDEKLALFFSRLNSSASIWINQVEIGNTGSFNQPLPNNWNHPFLFELPPEFLKEGDNSLYVRLKVPEATSGMLYEIELAPFSQLDKQYQISLFAKVTSAKILSVVMLVCAAIIFMLYFYITLPNSYLWFAAGCVCWSIYSTNLFLVNFPLSQLAYQWLINLSLLLAVCFYTFAVHRMLGVNKKILETLLGCLVVVQILSVLVLDSINFSISGFVFARLSVLVTLYIGLMLTIFGWRRRKDLGLWVAATGSVIVFLLAYDIAMYITQTTALFAKYPYVPMVATLCGAGIFFARFVSLTNEHELLKSNEQNVDSAINTERERLLQEIHDGVGGQLVSTLAILERGEYRNEDIMESVKTSLDDLRLIISSLEPIASQGDVLGILATVRERLEYRLAQAGIALRWQVENIPAVEGFSPDHALQLMRILQESITNVVKHANATEICIQCAERLQQGVKGIQVSVVDDGKEQQHSPTKLQGLNGGYGINSMKKRAAKLAGQLSVDHTESGTAVVLWIPLIIPQANNVLPMRANS